MSPRAVVAISVPWRHGGIGGTVGRQRRSDTSAASATAPVKVNDARREQEQIYHTAMVDRNIFLVEPRRGTLRVGESCRVALTYFHKFPGRHELPVIFHVKVSAHRRSCSALPPLTVVSKQKGKQLTLGLL